MWTEPRALWVVPCRYDAARPAIFECVEAIQRHHDDPHILIVDSQSEDQSYLQWCIDRGCTIGPINNALYATGAFAWAQRHYPDVEYFYFLFDSLIVQSNLDHMQEHPLTVVRHWSNAQHDWGWDADGTHLSVWGGEQLDRMGIPMPAIYHGVMGPMMFVQRPVVEQLDHLGYWFTQVTSSYLHCAMERVAGIVLEHLAFNIPESSIQGTHSTHEALYDERFVKKLNMGRA